MIITTRDKEAEIEKKTETKIGSGREKETSGKVARAMHGECVSVTSEQRDIAIRREHSAAGALANATTLLASIHVPVTQLRHRAPVCHSVHNSAPHAAAVSRNTHSSI